MARPVGRRNDTANTTVKMCDLEYEDRDEFPDKEADWYLFIIPGSDANADDKEVWVPRSLIDNLDVDSKTITVPEWWAIQKGLV